LWFATVNGLSVVDPRALPRNTNAPPVVIEEVLVDGALVWSSASEPGVRVPTTSTKVRVPPGPRRVEIRYTALSLTAPERVQFQRKIEGFDEDWLNVGTDRVASYQGLPPGEYGFRVIAANNDGVWNREGARLALIVQPAIWQTAWFRAGMAAALVGAAVAAYRRRIGMLERRRIQQDAFARQVLESQEAERRRIAAELHDGLGQDLVLAKNLALLGGQTSRGDSAVAERFTEISSATTRALDEVHAISYALRPPELDRLGLARALAEMIRRAEESSGIRFERRLDLTGPLPPGADIQIFRIAQEAVNNLVRHSGAKSARMDLWSDDAGVHLVVADDGRGFAITAHERSGLGLTGIAERIRLLGGRHDLVSRPGQGTTLTVLIPTATPPR
jgi:signal transduction histidine kinase